MTLGGDKKRDLSAEEMRVLREHWEWGGRYAMFWIVFTIVIFGGAHLLFDYWIPTSESGFSPLFSSVPSFS
jgi:hypothetical protein